jgi:hypothetical protein
LERKTGIGIGDKKGKGIRSTENGIGGKERKGILKEGRVRGLLRRTGTGTGAKDRNLD